MEATGGDCWVLASTVTAWALFIDTPSLEPGMSVPSPLHYSGPYLLPSYWGTCLGFSSVVPVFPLLPLPSFQDPSTHLIDLWAFLPTARRPGGPQDPPLQGEGLQEGETLWHLPAGHHSGRLYLQRCVVDGTQNMLLDCSVLGRVGSLLSTCVHLLSVGGHWTPT